MLLNYLYPELEDKWTAHHNGTFYRNYNEDVIELDVDSHDVSITRDGYVKLLPQGLITLDDDLKTGDFKEKYEALQRRKRLLDEVFLPFDTVSFRNSLRIERQVSELLDGKLDFILKDYFGYDLSAEKDGYVRELAAMLPYVSRLRGDIGFVGDVLTALLGYEVTVTTGHYSTVDDTVCRLPMVRYEVLAEGLDSDRYKELDKGIECLRSFISEWFMPFDTFVFILIKHHGQPFALGDRLVLGYNTEINS